MYFAKISLEKIPRATTKPDYIAEGVGDIDFDYLKSLGITTCFIDLDGTVVEPKTYAVTDAIKQKLKASGLDIIIATNRPRSRSLRNLKKDLNAIGVAHPKGIYGKPAKKYMQAILHDYGLRSNQVVMVGDRLIQDILGANRVGIYSVLVIRIGRPTGKLDLFISNAENRYIARLQKRYFRR